MPNERESDDDDTPIDTATGNDGHPVPQVPAVNCAFCDKSFEDASNQVFCKVCNAKYHVRCARKATVLSDGGYANCCSTITKNDLKCFFSNYTSMLKNDLMSAINSATKNIVKRLNEQDKKISGLSKRVTQLETDARAGNLVSVDKKDLLTELELRQKKACNVIFYDVKPDISVDSDLELINGLMS